MRRQRVSLRSFRRFAQQSFEFGEGVLDGIEIGRIGRQERDLGPVARIKAETSAPLWLERLSKMTISPGASWGARN